MKEAKAQLKRFFFFFAIGVCGFLFQQTSRSQDYDLLHRITKPGLRVQILDAAIPADRRPVVTFQITDEAGNPLDKDGIATMGPVDLEFIIARIKPGQKQYTAYTTRPQTGAVLGLVEQASTDFGGTYNFISEGKYTYKFNTVLPQSYENTATHTVGVGARRSLTDFGGKTYFDDDTFDFVPAGGSPKTIRDVVSTASCNQCHDPLAGHGGRYREVKTCVLCHTPQTEDPDTGNTLDFKVMVHKIHRGINLPSVRAGQPYRIIEDHQALDFSTVLFPTDIRNCRKCHSGATQQDNYLNQFSSAACGSCHDDVNFSTGQNHGCSGTGIPVSSDLLCSRCHSPTQQPGNEFDRLSVAGAHLIESQSSQALNIKYEIIDITNTGPGQRPTVTFTIKDKNGNLIPLSQMSTLAFVLAGPTKDYGQYFTADPRASAVPDSSGNYTYTFTRTIPTNAVGTWAVGIEGRIVTKLDVDGAEVDFLDGGTNVVKYFAVTDATPVPRRKVVDVNKCNACHDRLSQHESRRINNVEHCVLCHNPNLTDAVGRKPDQMPAESVDFRVMIHKIHTGEKLQTKPYVFYHLALPPGVSGPIDFSGLRYPGDRRNCERCHAPQTWLPDKMAKDLLPTVTPRGYINPTRPIAAVCTSCHDSLDAAAHAVLNTTSFGESCLICHGEGKEFSVRKVHSRVDTRSF